MLATVDTWVTVGGGLLIAVVTGCFGVLIARISKGVRQINRAVNHVPDGAPTLVQRVSSIERQNRTHREWEHKAFTQIADQLGVRLPPPPADEPVGRYIPTEEEGDAL